MSKLFSQVNSYKEDPAKVDDKVDDKVDESSIGMQPMACKSTQPNSFDKACDSISRTLSLEYD